MQLPETFYIVISHYSDCTEPHGPYANFRDAVNMWDQEAYGQYGQTAQLVCVSATKGYEDLTEKARAALFDPYEPLEDIPDHHFPNGERELSDAQSASQYGDYQYDLMKEGAA